MSFLKALSPKFFILLGTADSAMISASGFLVNLMAGRFLSIEAYGQFLILLTLASFALIFQSALVSTPYSILSQSEESDLSGCFRGALGMTLLLGLLSALGGVIAYLFYGPTTPFLLGSFALYLFLNLVQDFFRRHYYATRQEAQAFLLDFISYGGQVIVLFAQRFTLQLESLFFYLSMTSLLAVLISASLNRSFRNGHPHNPIHLLSEFKTTACQSWQLGRWLLFSNGVSWLVSQFYVVVLGYTQPASVTAQLGAARSIAGLSNPLVMAYESMALPRMSKAYQDNQPQLFGGYFKKTFFLGNILFLLAGLGVFLFPNEVIHLFYGKSFGNTIDLVRIFSIMPMLWLSGKCFSVGLIAMKETSSLLPVYVGAAFITLLTGGWLISQYGALGAGFGFLMNAMVLTIGFGVQFIKFYREWKIKRLAA